MRRTLGSLAVLLVACFIGALWLRPAPEAAPAPTAPTAVERDAAPPPVSAATARDAIDDDAPIEPAPAPLPEADPDLEARRLAALRADPDLADRARQQELAAAADARWEEAVNRDGYTANDLDVAVRELFSRLDLSPRYAEGGRIEGLVIQSMPSEHPLAAAGFRPGDRIDRIQGVPLRDPGELPSLLARLGPNFALCADRQGVEVCRDLQLE